MSKLKHFDLFRGVARDHKKGTKFGMYVSIISLAFATIYITTGLLNLTDTRLTTQLFLQSLGDKLVPVHFEIDFPNISCEQLTVVQEHTVEEFEPTKSIIDTEGCKLSGNYRMQPLRNKLTIMPSLAVMMKDMQRFNSADESAKNNTKPIDFSHVFRQFQIGETSSGLAYLNQEYPENIQLKTLQGAGFLSENSGQGHALFRYQLKIVNAIADGMSEYMYRYTQNRIEHERISPSLVIDMDFGMIAVKYTEVRATTLFEFFAYIFSGIGGGLALIKFTTALFSSKFSKRYEPGEIMEREMG